MTRRSDLIKEIAACFGRKKITAELETKIVDILLRHNRKWIKPPPNPEWLTNEKLDALAIDICEKHAIELAALKKSYHRKAPTVVVSARKEVTRKVMNNYQITWARLGRYMGNVNHSTMIYYFNGF